MWSENDHDTPLRRDDSRVNPDSLSLRIPFLHYYGPCQTTGSKSPFAAGISYPPFRRAVKTWGVRTAPVRTPYDALSSLTLTLTLTSTGSLTRRTYRTRLPRIEKLVRSGN